MDPEMARTAHYSKVYQVNTRWNPTREQLMILQDMYQRGIRTPDAQKIRQIRDLLALYGKIEGKNVFYWFQNHKARDRQKMRCRKQSKMEPNSAISAEDIQLNLNGGWNNIYKSTDECVNSINCQSVEGCEAIKCTRPKPPNTRVLRTLELFPTRSGL